MIGPVAGSTVSVTAVVLSDGDGAVAVHTAARARTWADGVRIVERRADAVAELRSHLGALPGIEVVAADFTADGGSDAALGRVATDLVAVIGAGEEIAVDEADEAAGAVGIASIRARLMAACSAAGGTLALATVHGSSEVRVHPAGADLAEVIGTAADAHEVGLRLVPVLVDGGRP